MNSYDLNEGMKLLKNRGGPGMPGLQNVNGHILTVSETAVVALAKDIIDDVCRRTGKKFVNVPFGDFENDVIKRSEGRMFSAGEVYAEIGRRQNFAIKHKIK